MHIQLEEKAAPTVTTASNLALGIYLGTLTDAGVPLLLISMYDFVLGLDTAPGGEDFPRFWRRDSSRAKAACLRDVKKIQILGITAKEL